MFVCVCHWLDYVVETQVYVRDVTCKRVWKGGRWRKFYILERGDGTGPRRKEDDGLIRVTHEGKHALSRIFVIKLFSLSEREMGSLFCLNFLVWPWVQLDWQTGQNGAFVETVLVFSENGVKIDVFEILFVFLRFLFDAYSNLLWRVSNCIRAVLLISDQIQYS